MRLEAEGKARLEAMKKALAVGLPLSGLLAGAAVVASVAVAEERGLGGDLVFSGGDPAAGGATSESDDAAKPEVPEEPIELTIATDVQTVGILLPPTALSRAERGGEADPQAADDVVIHVEDAPPDGERQP